MKLKILGTGGAAPIPRPTCGCSICVEARKKGIPYSRTGPSLYFPDIGLLVDLPEEIREQINREDIHDIRHVIISHWHPDHTLGIRVLEQINWNFAENTTYGEPIKVYLSKQQYNLFKKYSCGGFLDFYSKRGMIELVFLEAGDKVKIGDIEIRSVLIEKTDGYYFEFRSPERIAVYAPCEYHMVRVDDSTRDVDVFIVHNLFWEKEGISSRRIPPSDEDSFEKMLDDASVMGAKKIVIMHIEETFQLGHDELKAKMKEFYPDRNIVVGYDGMDV